MNYFSQKISNEFQKNLKNNLLQSGYTISCAQNALWKATASGVNVTCYESLKLLVQGKNTDEFVEKYLKTNAIFQQKIFSDDKFEHNFPCWIGTDESGKGDYIGPLVTSGVLVKREQVDFLVGLNIKDSKKLTDKFILQIAPEIKKNCQHSVIVINPEKYNELYFKFKNLNKLLAWAHSRAIENILENNTSCENAISDKFGDESLIKNALLDKGRRINLIQRTKAESDIAVACASVLAREGYLLRMKKLSELYGMTFAKGGGDLPTQQILELTKKLGNKNLSSIVKLHFKNTQKIINRF